MVALYNSFIGFEIDLETKKPIMPALP